jgi:hypothetical protein
MSYENTAAIILAGIATGTVIAVVGTYLWAGVWDALAVVFVAPVLVFIAAAVAVIAKS